MLCQKKGERERMALSEHASALSVDSLSTYKLQTRTLQGVGSHGGSRHDSVSCLFVCYCAGQLHAFIQGDRDTQLVVSEAGTTLRAAGQTLERQVR